MAAPKRYEFENLAHIYGIPPMDAGGFPSTPVGKWQIVALDGNRMDFLADEWDMKVVFTKSTSVGDRVRTPRGFGVVDGIARSSKNGPECWVRDVETGDHFTYLMRAVQRIGEA